MDSTTNEVWERKEKLDLIEMKIESLIEEKIFDNTLKNLYDKYEKLFKSFKENELSSDERNEYKKNLKKYYKHVQKLTSKLFCNI